MADPEAEARRFLVVNRCPVHQEFHSVSVDDEHGGTRISPSKCCGQWRAIVKWPMTAKRLREAARVFEDAAEEIEHGRK